MNWSTGSDNRMQGIKCHQSNGHFCAMEEGGLGYDRIKKESIWLPLQKPIYFFQQPLYIINVTSTCRTISAAQGVSLACQVYSLNPHPHSRICSYTKTKLTLTSFAGYKCRRYVLCRYSLKTKSSSASYHAAYWYRRIAEQSTTMQTTKYRTHSKMNELIRLGLRFPYQTVNL